MYHDTSTLTIAMCKALSKDHYHCVVYPFVRDKNTLPEPLFSSFKTKTLPRCKTLEAWQTFLQNEFGTSLPGEYLSEVSKDEPGLHHWMHFGRTGRGKSIVYDSFRLGEKLL